MLQVISHLARGKTKRAYSISAMQIVLERYERRGANYGCPPVNLFAKQTGILTFA